MQDVTQKKKEISGGGTTMGTVLARPIYPEGLNNVAAGCKLMGLHRGSQAAVERVVEFLSEKTKTITTEANISQVETISANDDTKSSARLISDSTPHTIHSSTPPQRRSLSGPIEGSDEEQQDAAEHTNCHQEISLQLDAVSQPRALPETNSGFSDPIITTVKTVECTISPMNSSSAGPAVTTLSPGETPERVPSPQRPVLSPHVEDLDLSVSDKDQTTL